MANSHEVARTNYFRVTDETRYAELFKNLVGGDDGVKDFTKEEDGVILHGFGAYGSVDYLTSSQEDEDDGNFNFDHFLSELQKILPEDEAFVYMESGHEKLRYLTGLAIIATSKEIRSVDLLQQAMSAAREMLGNESFCTQLEY